MIIPKDAMIAEEKVRDYLLRPLEEGDKSLFKSRWIYAGGMMGTAAGFA